MTRLALIFLFLFTSCTKLYKDSNSLNCLQITHRDGLQETISDDKILQRYDSTDFTKPQNYAQVVAHKTHRGQRGSCIMTYHDNGSLAYLLETKNGRANGKFYQYHDNGALYIQSTVSEGKGDLSEDARKSYVFEGPVKIFDEEQRLRCQMQYLHGRLEGDYSKYWPNGVIKAKIPYQKGSRHNDALFYDAQGKLEGKLSYLYGKKHGVGYKTNLYEETYEHGLLITGSYKNTYHVKNGQGIKAYFKNQILTKTVQIQEGKENGIHTIYSKKGHVINVFTMHDGKKEDIEYCYFDNADKHLEMQIPWLHDEIQGIVKTYYPNQKQETQTEMVKNIKNGLSITYYENSALMMMETYKKGKLTEGKYYPINASIATSIIENGTGIATIYTKKGEILRTIRYKDFVIQVEDDG